jgi:glycosyltransferase involved in cell wall biosynthesis
LKIGIFIYSYLPKIGGAQLSTHCLANSIVNKGNEVYIFTDSIHVEACENNGWKFKYKLVGVNIPRDYVRKISSKIWVNKITKIFNNSVLAYNLDVIQIINAWPWICFEKKKFKFDIPIYLRSVGDDLQKSDELDYGILRDNKIEKLIVNGYSNIDSLIANSKTTKNEYLSKGVSDDKIELITPGVDNQIFNKIPLNKIKLLNKYNIDTTKTIILAVGRNHKKKGYEYLVKSLKDLNQNKNKFILIIIGKNTSQLMSVAIKIDQENNFFPIEEISSKKSKRVTSFPSEELINFYKVADYFVLPSLLETFGNVKLEAMAAGTPVIVTDAPGARDAVIDFENGLVVKKESSSAICNAINIIESNSELKNTLVSNGLKFAKDQDWDIVASCYIELYNKSFI